MNKHESTRFQQSMEFHPQNFASGSHNSFQSEAKHHNTYTWSQQANLSSDHKFFKTQLSSEGIYVGLTLKSLSAAIIESSPCKPQ